MEGHHGKKTKGIENEIIGCSLNNLKELVINFSENGKNILLIGPRGVGKELFAKLYHEKNGRKHFVPINCAGISDSNLQSELFGHVKGSFTDAFKDRDGLLTTYQNDGLLFLDEIGDASQNFQAMLLRVLQTGDYKPFGSNKILNAKNICIIAATAKIESVRDDLKDRFDIFNIPELAASRYDILELVRHFSANETIENISQNAISFLKRHPWPGNVRQLKKVLREAVILCEIRKGGTLRTYDFPTLIMFEEEFHQEDHSKKERIDKLPIGEISRPHRDFFVKWVGNRPPDNPKPIDITNVHLNRIAERLGSVSTSINMISENKIVNNPSAKIDYEKITPDEYKNFFWEYHAEKGRGGTQIVKHFPGRINSNKTAARNLKDARARLKSKKSKGKN